MTTAIGDLQFCRTADLTRESNAACAHDTSVCEQSDLFANMVLVHPLDLGLVQATDRITIFVGIVLQIAFSRLIANGAIEWVIQQQQFERHLLSCLHLFRVRTNDRPFSDWCLATGDQLRSHHDGAVRLPFAHLDQAHSAGGDHGQSLMPTVMWDFDTGLASR